MTFALRFSLFPNEIKIINPPDQNVKEMLDFLANILILLVFSKTYTLKKLDAKKSNVFLHSIGI